MQCCNLIGDLVFTDQKVLGPRNRSILPDVLVGRLVTRLGSKVARRKLDHLSRGARGRTRLSQTVRVFLKVLSVRKAIGYSSARNHFIEPREERKAPTTCSELSRIVSARRLERSAHSMGRMGQGAFPRARHALASRNLIGSLKSLLWVGSGNENMALQLGTCPGSFRSFQLVKTEANSLGVGSYGAVYRAKCDQLVCAAKVLHPILFQTRDPSAYRIVERFQREIEFLNRLRHPNIIQYLGSCQDPESRLPVLFMELMDESLTSFLERPASANPPPLPFHVQVDIAHDVAQALSHLHHHEVLHRDLSSNNVLLIGSRRAKVTDFGMARLLGADPRLTQTYCPGTNGYMSPEALADPPNYTTKLDVFSCGVLLVQLVTRKWPNPGPRMHTIQVNDPRFPFGQVHVTVPELERRREHLDLVPPNHPLRQLALNGIKDKEEERPTADQLCSDLVALKESVAYRDSLQQAPEDVAVWAPARDQEMEQQLRESELRVEELRREVQQLYLEKEEDTTHKDELQRKIQTRNEEINQLQERGRESEQLVAALQQSVEQKDAEIQAKDRSLQEKERKVGKLLQRVREKRAVALGPRNLKWRDGPPTPFVTYGYSVTVSGIMVYCRDGVSGAKVLMFNSGTEQWTVLPECPKVNFSIAVVNGELTAVGGRHSFRDTNTLLSLSQDKPDISQQKWLEQLPRMTYCRNSPAIATTNTSLIVAGGWERDRKKTEVEVMDTQTLQWSTVASLPLPLASATATICGDRLYLGGGFSSDGATKSVLECEVKHLLQSQPPSLASRIGLSKTPQVWREVAPLPVIKSSLITFQGHLLAVGGRARLAGPTSEVREYDAATNSWNVISHMRVQRCRFLAVVLPNKTLMVCGGHRSGVPTASVEIASI